MWLPTSGNLLVMASMLLLAWDMGFTPVPSRRKTIRGVYGQARPGTFRTSTTAKLISVAAIVLFVAGTYLDLKQ